MEYQLNNEILYRLNFNLKEMLMLLDDKLIDLKDIDSYAKYLFSKSINTEKLFYLVTLSYKNNEYEYLKELKQLSVEYDSSKYKEKVFKVFLIQNYYKLLQSCDSIFDFYDDCFNIFRNYLKFNDSLLDMFSQNYDNNLLIIRNYMKDFSDLLDKRIKILNFDKFRWQNYC